MTRKEIAAKLREAVRLMNDKGAHWVQGEYAEEVSYDEATGESEYGYCSLGAIRHVIGDALEDPSGDSDAVSFALAAVLPPTEYETEHPERYTGADGELQRVYARITSWNDNDHRVWPEIVEKFEEAAKTYEQS